MSFIKNAVAGTSTGQLHLIAAYDDEQAGSRHAYCDAGLRLSPLVPLRGETKLLVKNRPGLLCPKCFGTDREPAKRVFFNCQFVGADR